MNSVNTRALPAAATQPSDIAVPLAVGSGIYNQVVAFLYREAWLLDHDLFHEWLGTLAADLIYTAPIRVTRTRADQNKSLTGRVGYHYHDTHNSMSARVRRILDTSSAWSDDPPVRCRRFITNVVVGVAEREDELCVRSYLQLARNRFEWPNYQWITGERNDLLRRKAGSFELVRREIVLDVAVLGTPNLALFL